MNRKNILLVDDDVSITDSLTPCLESEQVVVATAKSLEEAEGLLKSKAYDLVITDLRLSGTLAMEGLELLAWVKLERPDTPVVLMTAFGSPEIEVEAKRRGAIECWTKSIRIQEIISRVRALGIPAGPRISTFFGEFE